MRKTVARRPLQATLEFLLDNLFDLLTIVVAAYLVVRHQLSPFSPQDLGELATWILAVLGLIAVSGLWDRNRRLRRIETLSQEARDLVYHRLSSRPLASDFLATGAVDPRPQITAAQTIWIAGITLARTTREYMHLLGQRLVAGASIRLIVIDPENDAVMETMAARSMGETSDDYWRTRMATVRSVIDVIAQTPPGAGVLEIGYLPYIPSFGLTLTDPDATDGTCYVELYHHRSAEPNPAFRIDGIRDPKWFEFFKAQYEILWSSCRTERLTKDV